MFGAGVTEVLHSNVGGGLGDSVNVVVSQNESSSSTPTWNGRDSSAVTMTSFQQSQRGSYEGANCVSVCYIMTGMLFI